jgi:hypothetical protein
MREENTYDDLLSYYSSMYDSLLSNTLLREINSFQGGSNPYREIELSKEKKSEKPNFNQKKK